MSSLSKQLHERARLLGDIRAFFARRNVIETNTPLLSRAAVTDPAIESFEVAVDADHVRYLRTSPEFPLKRLLSAGAPDMFELGPVFRQGEIGRRHNPEFTLLEWYRLGFDMQRLVDEVVELLGAVGGGRFKGLSVRQVRYYDLFTELLGVDVRQFTQHELATLARARSEPPMVDMDTDQWLDYLFGTQIQPQLAEQGIVIVTHYPASQAALARLDAAAPDTALRFEVMVNGVELANGFEELTDSTEQAERFRLDNEVRDARGQCIRPVDQAFLASLGALPACSGVALGFDRLLMLLSGRTSIADAIAIHWDDA